MQSIIHLDKLTACLSKLPGLGRRSAERMALKLVRQPQTLLADLILTLQEARNNVCCCSRCGSVTSVEKDPCHLCKDPSRDSAVLCVVEEPSDVVMIERAGGYHGRYHVLMGKISPMKGNGPSDLRVRSLIDRARKEKFKEIILALSTDVEGDSTASFIADLLSQEKVRVSRLAFGLPAGSAIMYSDPVTLARAIRGRT